MIENIREITAQLKELSTVLNSFKSEAVQLRLVELIFGDAAVPPKDEEDRSDAGGASNRGASNPRGAKKRKRRVSASAHSPSSGSGKSAAAPAKNRRAGRPGGMGLLTDLVAKGFFKSAKTLADIVAHCERNLATKYKPNELSGPLGRLVRSQTLSRQKNGDKLYEYIAR